MEKEKRVLLLGAGMVSDPFAHYFSQQSRVQLTVASESPKDGQRLSALGSSYNNIESVVVDINKEPEVIDKLIGQHDLCVSLLPYTLHPPIAKLCIKNRKNMVTSSYITADLQALDEQ
jgi:alpha-aminoadipic semialdehyde synthase